MLIFKQTKYDESIVRETYMMELGGAPDGGCSCGASFLVTCEGVFVLCGTRGQGPVTL